MHALNLTIPIKQDAETKAKLAQIEATFATEIQPKIDAAMRKSRLVHFARVVNVRGLFLQVLTEYDGDHKAYADFFLKELPDVFATLFSVAEHAPSFGDLSADGFYELSKKMNISSMGTTELQETDDAGNPESYLFSAYGRRTVEDILPKL